MYSLKSLALVPLVALVQQASCAYPGSNTTCSLDSLNRQLSSINSPVSKNATILSAVFVHANGSYGDAEVPPDLPPMLPTGLPELCAVKVNVTSSESSSYIFALFLPSEWNSRLLTTGGGGTGGYLNYLDMGIGTHYGFAAMSTDNGHSSSPYDVTWAYNAAEKEIDWGWRAMHGSVGLSKQLIKTYYGEDARYSYYTGCSTGGRQGLKEAQVDADSFDGMLVGAPAWWVTHLTNAITRIQKVYYPLNNTRSIPSKLFPLIAQTVIEQCDEVDGVKDGIVSSPESCHPDFEVLNCESPTNSSANASACLTSSQLETLQEIYSDWYVGEELAYQGVGISSELGWSTNILPPEPLSFGYDFLRYGVLGDLNWPLSAWNNSVYEHVKTLDIVNEFDANKYDMSPFRDRGGKILMYHGLSDPLIVTRGSSYFYEQVKLATGVSHPITDWFRLFFIPGMAHCLGTSVDAPWHINGAGQNWVLGSNVYSVPGFQDPKHDALLALMDWVEGGKAVDQLIATTWHNQTVTSSGVLRQRPLCPYPKNAVYDGVGDVNDAQSWNCE
ncbi:tannase and feruloyl esterase [Annulohypoxylon maeteangense]|uniref:tannase and feruloyl esterase n=1 Tax=Annulohypoxylon maeteangense TaxID=1927788 RepID=UPI0020075E99|nr:tannase and feruloyl esterase [Annulohypoxylon maeteangense]KAI0888727.1 tannase and feruloyl esterase [Annulohypoxylon maeteangense]